MTAANKTTQTHAPSNPVVEDAGLPALSHPPSGGCGLRDWIPAMILALFLLPGLSWAAYQPPPDAVLKDLVSSRSESDATDPDGDTKTVGCSMTANNKMKVEIKLPSEPSGTYEWKIMQGGSPIYSGTLEFGNMWTATKDDLPLGFYSMEVTLPGVPGFKRRIDFLPMEIKVNKTDQPEDDLVPVSKGFDEDLATEFSVKVSGMNGLTAELSLKNSDGDVKFKDQTLTLTAGTEAKTKLWGSTHSTDKDKTIILVTLKKSGTELGKVEKKLTVFKGVKIEFGGHFYINVDTREFSRRPWDGRVDPKPNTKGNLTGVTGYMSLDIGSSPSTTQLANYKKAVDQCAGFGYQSAISFNDGDNSAISLYKPWKETLDVKVTKIYSKSPLFELTNDPLIDKKINMKKGVLDGLPDGKEQLLDPKIEVTNYFTLDNTTVTTRIAQKTPIAPAISSAQIQSQIAAAMGSGYDELLAYFNTRPASYSQASGQRYEWKNETFEVQKGSSMENSFAAKAIRGEKENGGKVEAKWIFGKWNEFKFVGELEEATIETK